MTYTQAAQTARERQRRTVYSVRRRRATLGAGLALIVAYAGVGAVSEPVNGKASTANRTSLPNRDAVQSSARAHMSRVVFPQQGQAALVLGNGRPAVSPHEQPVPIASVTKVMTAYLVLKRYPLNSAQNGFTVTITAAQAQQEAQDAAENQSVAAVAPGEQLTERQLLEALLIPSGNNIARLLAARVAGSDTRFVAEMNAEAQALGMYHTTYTDPSGWDTGTVSRAADQLRVFRQAMGLLVFRQIVSMASVTLPVAGTLANTNPLLAEGYFGKTGSDSAAGGCLAFFTRVTIHGRRQTAIGVVLGQSQDGGVSLTAAGQAAVALVDSLGGQQPVGTTPPPAGGGGQSPGRSL